MKKTASALLVLALLLFVARAVPTAVTFGEPDGTRHPFVGTIIFEIQSGFFACSATLMSRTVLMTAGHCTEEAGQTSFRTWATFVPAVSFAGIQNYPSLAAFLDDPVNGWIKGDAIPHPQFDDFNQFPQTYDVGVVILRQPVVQSTYGALPPLGFLEGIRRSKDNHFTVVGYGMQGLINPFLSDIYARYQGQVRLHELNSTFNGGQSAKFSNNPGTGGGTCFGDSGGPIFYGNTNMVTAVVSFGVTPCIGTDYNFRVDTAIAQDFLTQYIP